MNLDKYPVFSNDKRTFYKFLSEGPKGTIKKVVYYQAIGENLFNLAFGDWDEQNQMINDKIRSNNNDRSGIRIMKPLY